MAFLNTRGIKESNVIVVRSSIVTLGSGIPRRDRGAGQAGRQSLTVNLHRWTAMLQSIRARRFGTTHAAATGATGPIIAVCIAAIAAAARRCWRSGSWTGLSCPTCR
ncbi:MAG: hypothetical protein OXF57_01600, partial [Rhodospirillaceae bacterium]|nr:hypothetical protein [Rhodospirillaceae bacterium]